METQQSSRNLQVDIQKQQNVQHNQDNIIKNKSAETIIEEAVISEELFTQAVLITNQNQEAQRASFSINDNPTFSRLQIGLL